MKSTWIWYPGDFEVWLGNRFNNRRTERGAMFPPFWKQDSHWPTVEFTTQAELAQPETISICTEGLLSLKLDGQLQLTQRDRQGRQTFCVPQGRHQLSFKVWNQATPPALFVEGDTIGSGSHWLVTYEDKIWIDENGVARGSGIYVPAGSWRFDDMSQPPSHYTLACRLRQPAGSETVGSGVLYDFGRETFGHLDFSSCRGDGCARIYYGESREEALDTAHCETLDTIWFADGQPADSLGSKAFRYIYIENEGTVGYSLAMQEEYAPQERSGSFSCSDELLNRIWHTAAYTLDLTTQEFFMDGIKRDRWTWSGDAIQSYQMNYYLHFDSDCVKRTIRQLRGKDPVTTHVNTIMDYSFYWFKSVADYYQYTGDLDFVREIYPRMKTLMDYCLGRTNADGMAEGQADDWVFVDWVDFPMHKRGAMAFEQMLLCKALESMALCAGALAERDGRRDDIATDATRYAERAAALQERLTAVFWSEERHAYLHAVEDGWLNPQVTKFPNMFAVIYGYADGERRRDILRHVMLNPQVDAITTPYMRYYELEALCQLGLHDQVLSEIRDYWGGMLNEGATTFWEKYNPQEHGREHLAMYGRPYGKSLCHAWGASPLYLLGRYYLGVSPVKPGYEEFAVRPCLGDLEWMEGTVLTPSGEISVSMDRHELRVKATAGHGYVYPPAGEPRHLEAGQEVVIGYA